MAPLAGAALTLLAAMVAIPPASAMRESTDVDAEASMSQDESQNRSGADGMCCCRGPLPEQCYQIPHEHLFNRQCPSELGYLSVDQWRGLGHEAGIDNLDTRMAALLAKCARGEPLPMRKKTVNVIVFWMRHSYSCTNCLAFQNKDEAIQEAIQTEIRERHKDPDGSYQEGWQHMGQRKLQAEFAAATAHIEKQYEDPSITDLGVLRAQTLGGPIMRLIVEKTGWLNPPILCSSMLRAMETSLYAFPDKPVHVIPYVAELDSRLASKPNTPLPYAEQTAKLRRTPPQHEDLSQYLQFDLAPSDHPHRAASSATDAGGEFKKNSYLEFQNFMPGALEQLWSQINNRGQFPDVPHEIPVVLVGHGSFMNQVSRGCANGKGMRLDTKDKSTSFQNNEVTAQTYTVEWGAWDAKLTPVEKCGEWECGMLFEGDQTRRDDSIFFPPSDPDELCPVDVARCEQDGDQFVPRRLLDRHRASEACASGQTILQRDETHHLNYVEIVRGLQHDPSKPWEEEGLAAHSLVRAKKALKDAMGIKVEARLWTLTPTATASRSANKITAMGPQGSLLKGDSVSICPDGASPCQKTTVVSLRTREGRNGLSNFTMTLKDKLEVECTTAATIQVRGAEAREKTKKAEALYGALEACLKAGINDPLADKDIEDAMVALDSEELDPQGQQASARFRIVLLGAYTDKERRPNVRLPEVIRPRDEKRMKVAKKDGRPLLTVREDEHPQLGKAVESQTEWSTWYEAAEHPEHPRHQDRLDLDKELEHYHHTRRESHIRLGQAVFTDSQDPGEMFGQLHPVRPQRELAAGKEFDITLTDIRAGEWTHALGAFLQPDILTTGSKEPEVLRVRSIFKFGPIDKHNAVETNTEVKDRDFIVAAGDSKNYEEMVKNIKKATGARGTGQVQLRIRVAEESAYKQTAPVPEASATSSLQTHSDAQTGSDTSTAQVAMDAHGRQRVLSEVKRHE